MREYCLGSEIVVKLIFKSNGWEKPMLKIFEAVADDSHLVVPQMAIAHHVIAELINTRGIKADGKPTRSKHVKAVLVGEVPIKDAVKPYVNLSDKDKIPGVLVPTETKDGKLFVDKEVMQPQVEAANRMAKELIGIKKEAKQLLNKKKSERMRREYAEKTKRVEGSEVVKKPELGEELGAMFKEADRVGKKYQDETSPTPAKRAKESASEAATKPKPTNAKQVKEAATKSKPVKKVPKSAQTPMLQKLVDDLSKLQGLDSWKLETELSRNPELKKYIKINPPTLTDEGKAALEKGLKIKRSEVKSAVETLKENKNAYTAGNIAYTAARTNALAVIAGQKPPFVVPWDKTKIKIRPEDMIGTPFVNRQTYETNSHFDKVLKTAQNKLAEAATKPKPANAKQVKEAAAETLPPEPERMQTDLFGAATPVPKAPKNASNKRFSPEMLEYANKVLDDARQKVMKHDKLVEQWQPSKRAKALTETLDKLNRFQSLGSFEHELARDPSLKKYIQKVPARLTDRGAQLLQSGLEDIKQSDIDAAEEILRNTTKFADRNQQWFNARDLIIDAARINSISAEIGQDEPFKVPSRFKEPRPSSLWVKPAGYERTPHYEKVLKATRNKLANLPKSETEPPDFGKITVDLTKFGGAKYEVEPTIKPKKVGNKEIPGGIPQFQEWLNKDKTIKYDFGKPSAPTMPKGNPKEWKEALEGGDIDKATYDLLMNTQPKAPKKGKKA